LNRITLLVTVTGTDDPQMLNRAQAVGAIAQEVGVQCEVGQLVPGEHTLSLTITIEHGDAKLTMARASLVLEDLEALGLAVQIAATPGAEGEMPDLPSSQPFKHATNTAVQILTDILRRHDSGERIYQSAIMDTTKLSSSTVNTVLVKLDEAGWFNIETIRGGRSPILNRKFVNASYVALARRTLKWLQQQMAARAKPE
jgi:hypothetical protein